MAINRVIVDGEHKKMATCSNDGTAKVFDATKLDGKSATNRSKMSYNKQGGKLKSITFAQGGSAIATVSGMDLLRRQTGSVIPLLNLTTLYGRKATNRVCKIIRNWQSLFLKILYKY